MKRIKDILANNSDTIYVSVRDGVADVESLPPAMAPCKVEVIDYDNMEDGNCPICGNQLDVYVCWACDIDWDK